MESTAGLMFDIHSLAPLIARGVDILTIQILGVSLRFCLHVDESMDKNSLF